MKWNVILKNYKTGNLYAFNIFDDVEFRMNVEKLIERKYDRKRFDTELDLEAHHSFWAKIEWETIFTTWPPHINREEIERIINEYHINRRPGEPLPERIDVNLDRKFKIDVYAQLRANWERFSDYVWRIGQNEN